MGPALTCCMTLNVNRGFRKASQNLHSRAYKGCKLDYFSASYITRIFRYSLSKKKLLFIYTLVTEKLAGVFKIIANA